MTYEQALRQRALELAVDTDADIGENDIIKVAEKFAKFMISGAVPDKTDQQ